MIVNERAFERLFVSAPLGRGGENVGQGFVLLGFLDSWNNIISNNFVPDTGWFKVLKYLKNS